VRRTVIPSPATAIGDCLTSKELASIQENRCYGYAVNATVFPGMAGDWWYWSSSVYAYFPGIAWSVNFNNGFVYAPNKASNYHVRLARGGQ
jgi:hypothetical protein